MEIQERARQARLSRLAEDTEDFSIAMARKREIAETERQIALQKAEMDDARRRKLHSEDLAALRSRARLEESMAGAAHQRRLAEQQAAADAAASRARALAATELEAAETRQRRALEWETKLNTGRADNARALSSIRVSERLELERVEQRADQRVRARLEAQRSLVESQEKLARRLAAGPPGGAGALASAKRQIGYVTELG